MERSLAFLPFFATLAGSLILPQYPGLSGRSIVVVSQCRKNLVAWRSCGTSFVQVPIGDSSSEVADAIGMICCMGPTLAARRKRAEVYLYPE